MTQDNRWLKYFITEEIVLPGHSGPHPSISSRETDQMPNRDNPASKSLLVLLRNPGQKAVSKKISLFLHKILNAVNISEDDFAKIYLPAQWHSVPEEIYLNGPGKIVLFDSSVRPEGMTAPLYELQQAGRVQWLLADRLEDIECDVKKKKALWTALKKMFNLG